MPLVTLEKADAVVPGYIKLIRTEEVTVLLVGGADGPVAVQPACPHAGAPLEGGKVVGHRLRCPQHGYLFDLENGGCARARREGFGPLKIYPLIEKDGVLAVEV